MLMNDYANDDVVPMRFCLTWYLLFRCALNCSPN